MRNFFGEKEQTPDHYSKWIDPKEIQGTIIRPDFFEADPLVVPGRPSSSTQPIHSPSPALVIGFGQSGVKVLEEWCYTLHNLGLHKNENICATIIHNGEDLQLNWSSVGFRTRTFNLSNGDKTNKGRSLSERQQILATFRQASNHKPIKNYLQECLTRLGHDTRVYVIGSVTDPTISILGNILRYLKLLQGDGSCNFRSTFALLTYDNPDASKALEDHEGYASLREIARFTFNGMHPMEPEIGGDDTVVDANLLDHLSIVDTMFPEVAHLHNTPFTEGSAQLLGEALFSLTHTSGRIIWERLANVLTESTRIRQDVCEPVIHTFGVAALHLPVNELKVYGSTRLAREVLFGTTTQNGIVDFSNGGDPAELAKNWMTSKDYSHPVWRWLINVNDPSDIKFVPPVNDGFVTRFIEKLANQINQTLNESQSKGNLRIANDAVAWLMTHLEIIAQFNASFPEDAARELLAHMLDGMIHALQGLKDQLMDWIQVLDSNSTKGDVPSRQVPKPFSGGAPYQAPKNPFLSKTLPATETSNLSHQEQSSSESLSQLAQGALDHAYKRIEDAATGKFRRLVVQPDPNTGEIDRFYRNVLGLELGEGGGKWSGAHAIVRDRIGWWIQPTNKSESFKISLVCLPAEWGSGRLISDVTYSPDQVSIFYASVRKLCRGQFEGLRSKISHDWFHDQFEAARDFLSTAQHPCMHYDRNRTATIGGQAGETHGYIIASNPYLASRYSRFAFSDLAANHVDAVGGGEIGRLVALGITTNIPLSAVHRHRESYPRYSKRNAYHLYSQERCAKSYEREIRSLNWEGEDFIFSPQVVMTLVNESLVKLFFQSVFCKIIDKQEGEMGFRTSLNWVVDSVKDDERIFETILLSPAHQIEDFWEAFRGFVLIKPYDEKNYRKSINYNFHPSSKPDYISALAKEIKERNQMDEYKDYKKAIRKTLLPEIEEAAKTNPIMQGLAYLLQIELERLWTD